MNFTGWFSISLNISECLETHFLGTENKMPFCYVKFMPYNLDTTFFWSKLYLNHSFKISSKKCTLFKRVQIPKEIEKNLKVNILNNLKLKDYFNVPLFKLHIALM